jgi:hypothetical protein
MNDAPVRDAGTILSPADFDGTIKLSAGKKRHALVKVG